MHKVLASENASVQLAGILALSGSQSSVGKSVIHISKLLYYCNIIVILL